MLNTLDAKYGPPIGGVVGIAAGVWIVVRQHRTDSVIVTAALSLATLAAGILGGYCMRFLDSADPKPTRSDKPSQSPPDQSP